MPLALLEEHTQRAKKWQKDIFAFNDDLFGYHFWSAQRHIFELIMSGCTRIAIKAAHDVSKSHTCGFLATHNVVCHTPSMTFTTAPTYRQINKVIWKEIRNNYIKAKFKLAPKAPLSGTPEWTIRPDTWAFGASSDNPLNLQGLHEGLGRILIIGDEACTIDEEFGPSILSLAAADEDIVILIGNPDIRNPFFMHCFDSDLWETFTISAYDSPNFTGEKVPKQLSKALVGRKWVKEMIERFGEDSPIIRSKVHAEFPTEGADILIPDIWIQRALEWAPVRTPGLRWGRTDQGSKRAGIDIGREGEDPTVAYGIHNNIASKLIQENKTRLTRSAEIAKQIIDDGYELAVDDTGIGGAVTDMLLDSGYPCNPVNFSWKAKDTEHFVDARSEMSWVMRTWVRKTGCLPNEPELIKDLRVLEYEMFKSKIRLKSKEFLRTKRKCSTDDSDALMLAIGGHDYNDDRVQEASFEDFAFGRSLCSEYDIDEPEYSQFL